MPQTPDTAPALIPPPRPQRAIPARIIWSVGSGAVRLAAAFAKALGAAANQVAASASMAYVDPYTQSKSRHIRPDNPNLRLQATKPIPLKPAPKPPSGWSATGQNRRPHGSWTVSAAWRKPGGTPWHRPPPHSS